MKKVTVGEHFERGQGRPNRKVHFHKVVKEHRKLQNILSMSSKSFKEQKHDGILKGQ